jgi:hypothetical protein
MPSPTTIYLTPRQRKGLFARARRRKTSFSEEVRKALDFYLDLPPDFDEEAFGALVREANASMERSIARLDDAIAMSHRTMERISQLERR